MTTLKTTTIFDIDTCNSCGIHFGLPDFYVKAKRETHNTFYCPNGHSLHYPAKTALEKQVAAQAETIDSLRIATANKDEHINQLLGDLSVKAKAAKTHIRRAENGVCPHCSRTFKQVGKHVKRMHKKADVRTA